MAKHNFANVMDHIFAFEGGYVDHPDDPGGATNMGITHYTLADWRGHPVSKQDVKSLSKNEAREIYRANYWNRIKGDELPAGLDLVTMDGAVNSGTGRGAKWLQSAIGVTPDGIVGPVTIAAAREADEGAIDRAIAARMDFLKGLSHWGTFGKGWTRRLNDTQAEAHRMWRLPIDLPAEAEAEPETGARPGLVALLAAALAGILKAIFGGRK